MDAVLQRERPRLFGLAYRMLGSAADAEDVLQEAFVRVRRAEALEPVAFLTTVVTRLCLDELKSAHRRRETYVGPWFPEPIATELPSAEERIQECQSLSMAFMLVLDTLPAAERAAFVLREVLDTPYREVAEALGKSETACRQLVSRARAHVAAAPRSPDTSMPTTSLAAALVDALARQDADALVKLLQVDVSAGADHGGKAVAIQAELQGPARVSKLLLGLINKAMAESGRYGFAGAWVNHSAALLFLDNDHLVTVLMLDDKDGQIARLWFIRNPDKLSRLDADLRAGRVSLWA